MHVTKQTKNTARENGIKVRFTKRPCEGVQLEMNSQIRLPAWGSNMASGGSWRVVTSAQQKISSTTGTPADQHCTGNNGERSRTLSWDRRRSGLLQRSSLLPVNTGALGEPSSNGMLPPLETIFACIISVLYFIQIWLIRGFKGIK